MILEAKKIPFELIDVAADESAKKRMREIAGDPKALPPQLTNGDQYCGVREFVIANVLHNDTSCMIVLVFGGQVASIHCCFQFPGYVYH